MTDAVLWSLVNKTNACWLWTGAVAARTGYGKAGRRGNAHRVVYELVLGPVPDGLHLDHLCRNRLCVRPEHLEPVTARENLMRGDTHAAHNARKTQCPVGHPYDAQNTHVSPQGRRKCRKCMAEESKQTYARRKARQKTEGE